MPDLNFRVTGVESSVRNIAPVLQFKLRINNSPADETIQAVLLNAQIQIQCPQRNYSPAEKANLVELFGPPEMWGQTLRNRPFATANTTVNTFRGSAEAVLPVPCTFDLNVASARYFNGLEDGDVPLLFLFSGSVFYSNSDGRLQVAPISWNSECAWRMPLLEWRTLMDRHFPNTAWLSLRRDIFDQLCAYKRRHSIITWEQTIERLLQSDEHLDDFNPQSAIATPQSEGVLA